MSERTAAAPQAPATRQRATVSPAFRPARSPLLQRRCACGGIPGLDGECAACRARRLARQRIPAAESGPATAPPVVHEVLRGPGQPLDPATRAFMEPRFGHDFGRVRVHTDGRAAASARAVDALAYTVGHDVVFGAGQYAPHSPAGRRLLAHELTHVVQQSGALDGAPALQRAIADGDARSEARDEAGADRAARAVASGHAAPAIGASAVALRRQEAPVESEEQRQASTADLLCDIPALCRLRATSPSLVSDERIRAVATRCRPGALITINPCLSPLFMLPPPTPAGPLTPTPAGAGGGAASSGLNLGSLTTFRFNAGPVRFNVDLPSSATATLPLPLSGARTIEFSLNAAPTAFSFSAVLNGIPHVRIAARAGVDISGGTASAGLTVTTTRTVCRAAEPETARTEITAAGARLQKAINDWQSGTTPAPAAGGAASPPPTTLARLQEIGSAIGALYQAVERVKRPCEQRPVVTFGLGVQGPLGPSEDPARTPPSTVGGTLTFHF